MIENNAVLARNGRFRCAVPEDEIRSYLAGPAEQQPDWGDSWLVDEVRADLAAMPGLAKWEEVRQLRQLLREVAADRMLVIQGGDCAEDLDDCVPEVLTRKVGLLDALAGSMRMASQRPVVRVGRIAGQFAKPRSRPTETVHDREIPVFRGLTVNRPEPDPTARRPDPLRLLAGYRAAHEAMCFLRRQTTSWTPASDPSVWTSHEALLLDYELPLLRREAGGRTLLSSTHWPWIGERTRDPDGAHVRLLTRVANPVACKVGPTITPKNLLQLCELLDPMCEPGRLTLIARMGAGRAATRLARLVAAVREAGHPVIWMCDPMHGNTVNTADGHKTRPLDAVLQEVSEFRTAVAAGGGIAGGLHLEVTPEAVHECVPDTLALDQVGEGQDYTSLCDPRLNLEQALAVAAIWNDPAGDAPTAPTQQNAMHA